MNRFLGILLLVLPTVISANNNGTGNGNGNKKKLILLAGPHQTGISSVEKFFVNHASEYHPNRKSNGLKGWNWPAVQPNTDHSQTPGPYHSPIKTMDLLVNRHGNHTIQQEVLGAIQKAWKNSTHGVVMGSEEFDRVGDSPQSLGLQAMKRVVNKIGLSNAHVTVVLNYRTPRLDQWASLWKHHTVKNKKTTPYDKYVCDEAEVPQRWEMLESTMNPMKLAQIYREQGWNVVVLDVGGLVKQGLDLAHVVACQVMDHTDCTDDGWVSDKVNKTYKDEALVEMFEDFGDLDTTQAKHLEEMFLFRDCHYQQTLGNDNGFSVLHADTIWSECKHGPLKQQHYEKLADTDYLLDQIRAQKGCGKEEVHLDDVMEGKNNNPNIETISNKTELIGDEIEETLEEIAEEPLISNKSEADNGAIKITGIFLGIALALGLLQFGLTRRTEREDEDVIVFPKDDAFDTPPIV